MKEQHNIETTNLNDIPCQPKVSRGARLRMALAGSGLAGAMLLGGLLSGHASAAPLASNVAHMQAAPMSYNVADSSQASRETYRRIARQAARYYGISPNLYVRQIQQESGFNPRAYSPAGAEGIAQFMPATARSMGVNPWDPTSALYGGARLMSQLNHQFGSYAKALAGYNAGPGAVNYAVRHGGSNWLAWTPRETQNYVRIIMGW
jgi:soluble lytic murein transglycosylase-like protein